MIELSHSGRLAWIAALGLAWGLAGCCGGAPSHKCMFVPAPPPDAGVDASLPCGTELCGGDSVCCLKKIAPFAMCVAPSDYVSLGCEQGELACASPLDCPVGAVCCNDQKGMVTCKPDQLCPGDGNPTYRMCDTNQDCPRVQPVCTPVSFGDPDAGMTTLGICLASGGI